MKIKNPDKASARQFESFVASVFGAASPDSLISDLAEVVVPEPFRIRVKVVFSETDPGEVIARAALKGQLQEVGRGNCAYSIEVRPAQKHSPPSSVVFGVARFPQAVAGPQVQAILTICRYQEWQAIRRFVRSKYPRLAPVLLSQGEVLRSARKLAHATRHQVRVRALSAKERVRTESATRSRSIREWTNEELEAAIEDSKERQQTITSLDLEFFLRSGQSVNVLPSAICKIRSAGELEVTGSLGVAFENVAYEFAVVGKKKIKLLSGRGMRESNFQPQPLSIRFSRPVFEEIEAVREFVRVLKSYPNAMYSIQHGNPYAQATLTDLGDGSSFEVWAVPPSQIVLIPGLTASPAAFDRIVHHVYDRFKEGQLENYGPATVGS